MARPSGGMRVGPRGQWQCVWGTPQASGRGWQSLNPLTRPYTGCNTPRSNAPGLSHKSHASSGGQCGRTPKVPWQQNMPRFQQCSSRMQFPRGRCKTHICAHRTAGAIVVRCCRRCRYCRHRFHRGGLTSYHAMLSPRKSLSELPLLGSIGNLMVIGSCKTSGNPTNHTSASTTQINLLLRAPLPYTCLRFRPACWDTNISA